MTPSGGVLTSLFVALIVFGIGENTTIYGRVSLVIGLIGSALSFIVHYEKHHQKKDDKVE